MTSSGRRAPHPRARALRISYALTTAWLVALSAGLGAVTGEPGATLTCLVLFSFSLGLTAVFAGKAAILPSGGGLTRTEGATLRVLLALALLGALALILEGALNAGTTSDIVFAVTLAPALVLGVVALFQLLRARRP